jgi:uncharacterized membrane protein (Fun14 family)
MLQANIMIGGAFLVGVLLGYGIKKVLQISAVTVGLLFGWLTYLQYQQIVDIIWNKLEQASVNTMSIQKLAFCGRANSVNLECMIIYLKIDTDNC